LATISTGSPLEVGDDPPDAPKLAQELRTLLEPGETLLWQGYPRRGLMLRPQDATLIPFSLIWGGFAIFWEWSVISSARAPVFFELWGIPFVCVGLYLIGGRFIWDAMSRAQTIYAVTNQRVVIISGVGRRNMRSLELQTLAETNLTETSDGRGTITFGPVNPYSAFGRSWPGTGRVASPAFESIMRARDVLKIIRDATSGAR
jgi:hypothetical protein